MPFDSLHALGKNFAPVEPLADAKRIIRSPKDNPSSLNAWVRDEWDRATSQFESERREVMEQARVIQNMRGGKLVMKRDMSGHGWVFFKPLPNASRDRSNFPVFPQNSETLKSKWMKANPSMQAEIYGDGYLVEQAMRDVNMIVKHYFNAIFSGPEHLYESDEALSAQDYGTYITQFFYDERLNQIRKAIPVIQNESRVMVPGYGACLTCGYEGHPKDFERKDATYPQCPECDGFRTTKMVGDAVSEVPAVVGMDEIVQGDISGRLLNWASCLYDYHDYAHNSSYFGYSEYVPLRMAQTMFGQDLELTEMSSNDLGLQLTDALAARGGHIEGLGEDSHYQQGSVLSGRVPMHSLWLTEERYRGFRLKKAERTLSGTIPADVPFEEIFQGEICVVGYEDMRLQVGLFGERKNIASACYLTMSGSGVGKGLSDGVDIAKDLNEMHSMAMAGLKRLGATGLVVDSSTGVTQEQVRNMLKPHRAVMINLKESGVDDIRKAVQQLELNPVNQALPQYAIQQMNLLNMVMMTGDFTQGMVQDVDIDTLGGQQLAHAKTEEQKGAILTGKVFHRQQAAGIIVSLFRQHIKEPKWFKGEGETQGATRGKLLTGDRLPDRIQFSPVPNSELPVNDAERKMATRELFEKAGGLGAIVEASQAYPKETAFFLGQYGVKMPTLDTNQMQLVCLGRLDEIKKLAPMLGDPIAVFAKMVKKPRIDEPLHILKAEFLSSMLDDDQADEWHPAVFASIQALIDLHYELAAQHELKKAMIQGQAEMKFQAMMAQKQQEIMQPQMEAQAAAEEEEQVKQLVGDVAGRVLDEESKEAQHQRDMERDEAGAQRQVNLEREKALIAPRAASAK